PVLLSRERTAFGVSRIDGRHDQRYPQVGYDREEAMLVLDLSTGDSLLVPLHHDPGELHPVDTPARAVAAIHRPVAPRRGWSPRWATIAGKPCWCSTFRPETLSWSRCMTTWESFIWSTRQRGMLPRFTCRSPRGVSGARVPVVATRPPGEGRTRSRRSGWRA